MVRIYRTDLSFIFDEIAKQLDISDSLFEDAEKKYQAVGEWLGEGTSPLAKYSPKIYTQGSFLLGTVTKPIGEKDEYDIDLVFEMILSKSQITQNELKKMVGDRLKDHKVYLRMLDEEGRRCWTLLYADGAKFHLDILPAVPNADYGLILKNAGVESSLAETSIAITDNTLPNYERIDPDWPRGNPKGYANWFRSRMAIQYEAQLNRLKEVMKAEIQDVPLYRIKTPLQRGVQLLKRHRDIVFEKSDDKPASIVITTLAAQSYSNELDIVEALTNIVDKMPTYIVTRGGIPWVPNPVDPMENFADRWQDRPGREEDFRNWLKKFQIDLKAVLECEDIDRIGELLVQMFGERVSVAAVNKYKERTQPQGVSTPPVIPISSRDSNKPWGF
jgi:hypothetical protein